MDNRLISILTDPAVGGTFLTWSIHFLAGDKQYFSTKDNAWKTICDNPISEHNNAHQFKANQPLNKIEFDKIFSQLTNTSTSNFHTVYFHNFQHSTESYCKDLSSSISQLSEINSKIVKLTVNKKHHLYNVKYNPRTVIPKWTDNTLPLSINEYWDDFIEFFYKKDIQQWRESNLTSIWDRREFLALNLRPEKYINIGSNINLKLPHYSIDSFDLYNTFDQTVDCLFDFLELTIDVNQKQQWDIVYRQWQKIHTQSMLFVWYFDEIIDAVINNYYMDLSRFKLDLIQESIIQHHLIYNHNLNLKSWQLDKFTDTRQLHNLLESNPHS